MDKKLQRLETFSARGTDGRVYTVHGYEHLALVEGLVGAQEQWESTGMAEYKLATGELVEVRRDGSMRVSATGVELTRETAVH